ncbi:Ribose operon repressor [subsurface metagenome]
MAAVKSIKDIAQLAGVSQSTVSKALNDMPDVGAATKRRIKAIAEAHEFRPNAMGRGLKRQTTESIGVLLCRESQPLSGNPFYSRVLEGIEAELAINNFNMVLHMLPDLESRETPKMIRDRHVDGMILVGVMRSQFIERLERFDIPVVLVDPKTKVETFTQVLIDNEHGGFLATQYLIKKGYSRIAFISGDLERLSFRQRHEGYRKALKFNNIPYDSELVKTGGLEKGYDYVKELVKLSDRPTAIFAGNDINAIYGFKAIKEMKLEIPDDISIIGFDDISLANLCSPPLSTIRVYKEEMGSIAVRVLLKIMGGEIKTPVTTMVPVKLIERESVKFNGDI